MQTAPSTLSRAVASGSWREFDQWEKETAGSFDIANKALSFPELDLLAISDEVLYDSIYAALKLLLAAVVRDLWVVDERESVFAAKSSKRLAGVRVQKTGDGSPSIVYLSRIHDKEKPTPHKCAESVNHKVRAAHYVHQHFRKVGTASDAQLILAKRYGYHVPDGYAFVRTYERGMRAARAVTYRSRSALQSLDRIVGPAGDPGPEAVTHSTPSHFRNIPRSQPGRANKSLGSMLTDGRDEDPPGFSQGGRS